MPVGPCISSSRIEAIKESDYARETRRATTSDPREEACNNSLQPNRLPESDGELGIGSISVALDDPAFAKLVVSDTDSAQAIFEIKIVRLTVQPSAVMPLVLHPA